jgi:hypothetical protein
MGSLIVSALGYLSGEFYGLPVNGDLDWSPSCRSSLALFHSLDEAELIEAWARYLKWNLVRKLCRGSRSPNLHASQFASLVFRIEKKKVLRTQAYNQ